TPPSGVHQPSAVRNVPYPATWPPTSCPSGSVSGGTAPVQLASTSVIDTSIDSPSPVRDRRTSAAHTASAAYAPPARSAIGGRGTTRSDSSLPGSSRPAPGRAVTPRPRAPARGPSPAGTQTHP